MLTRYRFLALLGALVLFPTLQSCERLDPTAEEQGLVENAVRGYLDRLAASYSGLNAGLLEGLATPNEIAAVDKQLRTLASSGDRVHATLLQVDVTRIQMFRVVNASVETVEVWDVQRYDVYTGREKGRNPASIQRALLQLRRVDGRWLVSARMVLPATETPTAPPTEGEAGS